MLNFILSTSQKITSAGKHGVLAAFPWIASGTGIGLLIIAHFAIESDSWKSFYTSIGTLIFTGGVFSAFLKSYQFINLFSDELLKVFKGDEFANTIRNAIYFRDTKPSEIGVAAQVLANRLLDDVSPELAPLIGDKVAEFFNLDKYDFYTKKHERKFNIRSYDPKTDVIIMDDEYSVQIIPCKNTEKISYYTGIKKTSSSDMRSFSSTSIDMKLLIVNGEDLTRKYNKKKAGYTLTLSGSKTYDIRRKFVRTYKLRDDPFHKVSLSRPNMHLDVQIHNHVPHLVETFLLPNGFSDDAWNVIRKSNQNKEQVLAAAKNNLTLPEQGYLILFNPVTSRHDS